MLPRSLILELRGLNQQFHSQILTTWVGNKKMANTTRADFLRKDDKAVVVIAVTDSGILAHKLLQAGPQQTEYSEFFYTKLRIFK